MLEIRHGSRAHHLIVRSSYFLIDGLGVPPRKRLGVACCAVAVLPGPAAAVLRGLLVPRSLLVARFRWALPVPGCRFACSRAYPTLIMSILLDMVTREEVIRFVEVRLGFKPTPTTRFWWDTGTTGLDVVAFWEEFVAHFNVDMTSSSEGYDYGDSDGGLGDALEHLVKRLTFQRVSRPHHFTIDHLVEVANRKKWFDPPLL